MTEQEKAAFESAQNSTKTPKGKAQTSAKSEIPINTDLTKDYEAGKQFVDARVKAFGAGVRDRMAEVQSAFQGFSGGQFVITEATYNRPALPASPEDTKQSVIGLLFGDYEAEDNG